MCMGNTCKCPWGCEGGMLPAKHTSQQSKSCGTNWCLPAKWVKWLLVKERGFKQELCGQRDFAIYILEGFQGMSGQGPKILSQLQTLGQEGGWIRDIQRFSCQSPLTFCSADHTQLG